MARRSQCSSAGDNPLDPNYLPPHYREEYRLAVDALVESGLDGYYEFLQKADVVDFLSTSELQYIQSCIQAPRQSSHPEQQQQQQQQQLFLDGDGSSDTYWPVHSDLDVPGLDLGWPQVHAFMEPTEVTTLVNPPEPDMPSIKEQARRLIKNAQQVVAVAMDVFTDVDMFADILNAAARRVAVYVLLDEQNAHHFVGMVANCRVNLDNFQFLRVRTVSGIAYRCRSGRSFKGQMMDRFLLTDCRAVLSGNYSFMWSFEKLHRCMAHLFLGQLVTTFDEEFRILFAQSQPLVVENVLAPMEDLNFLQQKQYFNENAALHRDPRKFLTPDSGHPDEWERLSYDKRMDADWRMMALKKQDSLRGPADMYSRFGSQQPHMDPCFDQGPARMLMTENTAFKRHSYAEGVHSRYSMPFMQGMPEAEPKGKVFHRGQQPYPGPEPDYSGYDRFWNQDYLPPDQYPEPYPPQEVPPPDNFDPVLNYLSSTRNLDLDQSSEKFPPAADLPYASPRSKRRGLAQPYACQTSPTPSNSAEQNQFLQDPAVSRKDPAVKQGLRNWRISSYLSAYENPEEEGLPLVPLQGPDAFEEPPRPMQQTAPGMDLMVPKMPYVKEFKAPAIPRPSQMPSYVKTPQEKPKIFLDEPVPAPVEIRVTPTPSESSADGEKTEEPKVSLLAREDSFRRQYNAAAQRSSRLRSSLIFSSLDQQAPHETDQPDEEKNKTELTKLPFAPHVSRQRKPAAREPLEWIRLMKPTETSKTDDKDSLKEAEPKDLSENPEVKETIKQPAVESTSTARSKPSEAEPPKTDQPLQPTKPFLTAPLFVDMSDADQRFMFFKELAAKRKAAEATKAEKKKDQAETKPQADSKNSFQKQEPLPSAASELRKASISEGLVKNAASGETETRKSALNVSENTSRKNSLISCDFNTSSAFTGQETKPSDSEKTKLDRPSASDLPAPAETDASQGKPKGQTEFSNDSPSPLLPRSTSSEAKLPETDRSAEPTKPSRLYGDENDPYKRFMYFKQLAAKQKVDEATKDRSEIKPQVDHKTGLVTPESVKPLISESLLKKKPVVESLANITSTETHKSLVDSESGSEKTELDKQSLSFNRRTSLEQTKDSPSPSLARSMSSDAKLQATDQLVEPTKPLPVDANNPYRKFLYFKELSGKQNATNVEKDKDTFLNVPSETKTHESSDTQPKLSESAVLDNRSVSAGADLSQNKSPEEPKSDSFIKRPAPFLARSKSTEAELPKTDQLVPPTKPLYADMSDTEKRFSYFKELAAKRKAALAEKERTKAEMKRADVKVGSVLLEDPNEASNGTNVLMSEVKSSEATVSAEASESVSSLDEKVTKVDRLVEVETPQTCGDHETKLFISEETDTKSAESLAEPSVSDLVVDQSAQKFVDKTELGPESASGGSVSDSPSLVESSLETKTKSVLSPEENTGSELNSSDQPVPGSGSQNLYPLTEHTSSSDVRPELSDADESKAQEFVGSSLQESSQISGETLPEPDVETGLDSVPQSAQEASQKPDGLISGTGFDPASSENPSADGSSVVGSDICSGSEPNPLHSISSEECSAPTEPAELGKAEPAAEEREASESSEDIKPDSTIGPESGLLGVSGSVSKPDVDENIDPMNEDTLAPSHDLDLTAFDAATPAETVPSEPEQSVLSPEAERTEPDVPAVGSNCVSSETRVETEVKDANLTNQTSETPEPAELGSVETDDRKSENPEHQNKKSASSDKTNHQINQSNGSETTEATSKQPKPNPARYHSSTANVLSSSNLRDDTKLLLGKISANCQSRNETNREPPVTDDEKEDENAKNEKDGRFRTSGRAPAKPNPEREKVLEKFDSMRKEKRVYSRFMF